MLTCPAGGQALKAFQQRQNTLLLCLFYAGRIVLFSFKKENQRVIIFFLYNN